MKINLMFAALSFIILGSIFFMGYPLSRASAITVSPVRLEVSGDPGQTLKGDLILINEQSMPQKFYSSYANFESRGSSGTPYFVPATQGLGTWITVPAEVDLQPGQQENVPFAITIPSGASPGGYYAAIFWSPSPGVSGANSQVAITSRTGILVLLTVKGTVKISGALSGFKATGQFFNSLPIKFEYTFANGGGDRVDPEGNIYIKNMWLWTSATLSANGSHGNILPNSVRTFDVDWGNVSNSNTGFFDMVKKEWSNFHFGIYNAELKLNYGQSSSSGANYMFFVFPWQLLILVFVVLFVVISLLIFIIRKWDAHVVRRSREAIEVHNEIHHKKINAGK